MTSIIISSKSIIDSDCNNYGVTKKEIANALGISVSTLYSWIYSNNYEKREQIRDAIKAVNCLKN